MSPKNSTINKSTRYGIGSTTGTRIRTSICAIASNGAVVSPGTDSSTGTNLSAKNYAGAEISSNKAKASRKKTNSDKAATNLQRISTAKIRKTNSDKAATNLRRISTAKISGSINYLIDAIAAIALKVDQLIAIASKKIFKLLPEKMREKITNWNEKYKGYRNRLMRIDDNSSSPSMRTADEIGDVPGWVLVVLMTTGLVTALWTIAAPRLSQILKNSLDSMNSIR
jgi:hypothetical protein